ASASANRRTVASKTGARAEHGAYSSSRPGVRMIWLAHWQKGRRPRRSGKAAGPCHARTYLSGAVTEQPQPPSRAQSTARSFSAARDFRFARGGIRFRKCRLNDYPLASYGFGLTEIVVRDAHQLSLH